MNKKMVALVRGINVGRAKRVSMQDLRSIVENLGYQNVTTVLNSGNVIFTSSHATPRESESRIKDALYNHLGISARIMVLTDSELAAIVAENTLVEMADNPSRLVVAILAREIDREPLETLLQMDWTPESLALGRRWAYLWCPNGQLKSPLAQAVTRIAGDNLTMRNWATLTRLHRQVVN